MGIIGVQARSVRIKRGEWCQWKRPRRARYKLNVDGSARNDYITCGGVIRDEMGNAIVLFSYYYGEGTIMEAEYMALIDGLELCTSMGLSELDVESDSQVLVMAICIQDNSSWKHIHVLRRCLAIWRDYFKTKHIFRLANIVADGCTNWVHTRKTRKECYSETDLRSPFGKRLIRIELEFLLTDHDLFGSLQFFSLFCLFGMYLCIIRRGTLFLVSVRKVVNEALAFH